MKRVACLYRVSTKKQVDQVKDDIPMQKIACHEFAEKMGWMITIEKEEKGISGFKVSANKRDAIQVLKEAALHDEFDVLLVFMFDRLGRIDNETPFILEWFTEHGISVWSVNEGEQKVETHTDKLMNYIRFWQASGESEKTSIRVRTRLQQMTTDGIYTGGVVPFGYKLENRGRMNKKGQPMRDLVVDPDLVSVVKMVFSKVKDEGYGTHKIATMLNEMGYTTNKLAQFQANNVHRMLKNEIYRGFFVKGSVRSERIEELQIISDADFLKVQDILQMRNGKNEKKRTVAMSNRSKSLLGGNIYCAHCGCRLTGSRHIEKYVRRDGTETRKEHPIYVCYHRSRGLNDCDGATTYMAEKVDSAVMDVLRMIFANIAGCPEEEKIQQAYKSVVEASQQEQRRLAATLEKDQKQLELMRLEIPKAILGESTFSQEDLSSVITVLREKITASEKRLTEIQNEVAEKKEMSDGIIPAYRQFRTWASEFEESSIEAKKMIVNEIFSRIEIGKGYKIRCIMNFTYKQFCEDWMTLDKKSNILE